MEFPVTVESQDDFDKLIGSRLTREREKYADHDDLKAQVATLTAAAEAHEAAVQAANERADGAEKWKVDRESADALAAERDSVAKAHGLPASALRGSTKEELEAHALDLKPLTTASGPAIPHQGDTPKASATTEESEFVRDLFGGDAD